MSYYVHHVPGRVRVRIPAIRRNPYKAIEVENLLDLEGVDNVEINHLTGSVVVIFNPDVLSAQALLDLLSQHGYFDSCQAITCDDQIQKATSAAATKAGQVFFGWAVGKALESGGFSLLAAII